jgi:hypothetical protein
VSIHQIGYSLNMNGDLDEANNSNICLSSNSTTAPTSSALQKQQQINRRRAFFHDDVIITDTKMNSTTDDTTEENPSPISINHEENPTNKSFKRKVVSFSTMPSEKKVADGKIRTH